MGALHHSITTIGIDDAIHTCSMMMDNTISTYQVYYSQQPYYIIITKYAAYRARVGIFVVLNEKKNKFKFINKAKRINSNVIIIERKCSIFINIYSSTQ